jgi:hypothetical protein
VFFAPPADPFSFVIGTMIIFYQRKGGPEVIYVTLVANEQFGNPKKVDDTKVV